MDMLTTIALFFVVGVAVVLAVGLGVFTGGGEANKKHANRLMRYRIAAQAVAVVVILIVVAIKTMGGE